MQQTTQELDGFRRMQESSSSRLRADAEGARAEAKAAITEAQAAREAWDRVERENRELQASLAATTARLREVQAPVLQPRSRPASPARAPVEAQALGSRPASPSEPPSSDAASSRRGSGESNDAAVLTGKLESALQVAASEGQRRKELEVRSLPTYAHSCASLVNATPSYYSWLLAWSQRGLAQSLRV